jgi:hypothetical protein
MEWYREKMVERYREKMVEKGEEELGFEVYHYSQCHLNTTLFLCIFMSTSATLSSIVVTI